MPTQSPIPPLLQPFLTLPRSNLTLLTSTLGASTNWLVPCFIHAALKDGRGISQNNVESDDSTARRRTRYIEEPIGVVLVSWLRNASWWNDVGRKFGLDLSQVKIIDALSIGHSLSPTSSIAIDIVEKTILRAILPSSNGLPPDLDGTASKPILILDGIELLYAATAISGLSIDAMILGIREHVYATIITAGAGGSLTDSRSTPLHLKNAAFLTGMMHQASLVMSVRELDTGVAKDVSGVVRITKGAGLWGDDMDTEEWQEKEYLYFVSGDGKAKVFERGT